MSSKIRVAVHLQGSLCLLLLTVISCGKNNYEYDFTARQTAAVRRLLEKHPDAKLALTSDNKSPFLKDYQKDAPRYKPY